MRDPERPDLSALDWQSSDRWERMIAQIMARSATELQRRRVAGTFGLFDGLLAWARPALATAAALALLSAFALARVGSTDGIETDPAFFRSASLPGPIEAWLEAGEPPTVLDLFVLTSGEN